MGRKILITGATGFIGSHLAEYCVEQGYEVRAYDRYNPGNDWGWLENSIYRASIDIQLGDIRDYDSVSRVMKGVDVVFHLAALIGIPYSYISPLAYIKTNVEGTYNVLESARNLEIENLIVTSTSETYGNAQYIPIDEKHPMVGQSPYSASKIAADQLAISYYRSFKLPVKIARPFNVYGPRQSARAIIPTVITQILSGEKRLKLGNLEPTRDLTFVKDSVKGFEAISECEELVGEITNIGIKKEISIGDLVTRIARLMEREVLVEEETRRVRVTQSEVTRLLCDNSKILKYTDWRPEYDLDEGLRETIQWVTENIKHFKPSVYCV